MEQRPAACEASLDLIKGTNAAGLAAMRSRGLLRLAGLPLHLVRVAHRSGRVCARSRAAHGVAVRPVGVAGPVAVVGAAVVAIPSAAVRAGCAARSIAIARAAVVAAARAAVASARRARVAAAAATRPGCAARAAARLRCWIAATGSRLCSTAPAAQNIVLALAEASGIGWITSQCSTTLPPSSRKMSTTASPRGLSDRPCQ
jgi:hypothetical protein